MSDAPHTADGPDSGGVSGNTSAADLGDVAVLLGLLPSIVVLFRALAPAAQSPPVAACREQLADEAHAILGVLLMPAPLPSADRATLVSGLTRIVERLRRCPCRDSREVEPALDSINRWLVRLAVVPDDAA